MPGWIKAEHQAKRSCLKENMRVSSNINSEAEEIKSEGVQLKHLLLDSDFLTKPKIKALKFEFKSDGVLLYIEILGDMSRATNAEIHEGCIFETAKKYDFHEEQTRDFIKYLLEHGLIFNTQKPKHFSNTRVKEDQEQLAQKQDKWRKTKRRQREETRTDRGQCEDETWTNRGQPLGHVNIEQLNTEDLNRSKIKTVTVDAEPEDPQPPPDDPLTHFADEQLQKPENAPWSHDSRYVNVGRRPMKKYPDIWLTVAEMRHILTIYESLPRKEHWLKQALQLVTGKLRDKRAAGENIHKLSAYNWLIGWAFTEVQHQSLNEIRQTKATMGMQQ